MLPCIYSYVAMVNSMYFLNNTKSLCKNIRISYSTGSCVDLFIHSNRGVITVTHLITVFRHNNDNTSERHVSKMKLWGGYYYIYLQHVVQVFICDNA